MLQKGVTLIQLVVLIIVLLIIVSFAIFSVDNITDESIIAREYESLKEVKIGVDQTLNLIEMNPEKYKEEEKFVDNISGKKDEYYSRIGLDSASELSDRSYLINSENQDKLEINKILEERSYVVDLENEKYYIVDGVQRKGKERIYEYSDISREFNLLSNQ